MTRSRSGWRYRSPRSRSRCARCNRSHISLVGSPRCAIARGILFAIDQPPEVDVGSIVIRPTAQG